MLLGILLVKEWTWQKDTKLLLPSGTRYRGGGVHFTFHLYLFEEMFVRVISELPSTIQLSLDLWIASYSCDSYLLPLISPGQLVWGQGEGWWWLLKASMQLGNEVPSLPLWYHQTNAFVCELASVWTDSKPPSTCYLGASVARTKKKIQSFYLCNFTT